jgi:long-chain acyl-CoA synthetase
MTVGDILRKAAREHPDKIGVIFGLRRFSWREFDQRVNSLANALLGLGLKRGSRVAILAANCNEYLETNYAAAKAGLVTVPTNVRLAPAELSYTLSHASPSALIVHPDFVEAEKAVSGNLGNLIRIGFGSNHPYGLDYETLISVNSQKDPEVEVGEDDLWLIAYTSGTTGAAKGVMISHRNACSAEIALAKTLGLESSDVYLLSGPFYFNGGGGLRLAATWVGATIVIVSFEAETVLQTIQKERVTCFHGGTTPLSRLVNHPDVTKYDLSSVRKTMVTGSRISPALWQRTESVFGPIVNACYGLTETIGNGTYLSRGDVAFEGALSHRLSSSGKPMMSLEIKVVSDDGKEVPRNGATTGEIIMKGDPVATGYWRDSERTAAMIRNGWLHTGDIAAIDEDGFLYILDRKSEMIKSGGVQIFPAEVENVINRHPAVKICAVFKVPDSEWGETPKALVVLKDGVAASEKDIIEHCKKYIASYKKPTSVEFVDSLPMTEWGKILRKELVARYWKK